MSGRRERGTPRLEERKQQPEIEQDGSRHRAVGKRARRELEGYQRARQAETDDPDVEAHADAPESLSIHAADRVGTSRDADQDAGHDPRADLQRRGAEQAKLP